MPSDEQYLDALRDLAADLGTPPTKADMNEQGPHSTTPYYTRWGSWNAALEAAGLEKNHYEPTDEELLEELRRLAEEYGEPVLVETMDNHGKFSSSVYFDHFESWFHAREQAGLVAADIRPGSRVSEDELVDALRELALDLGRPPSQSEMDDRGEYSAMSYIRTWGSWNRALEETGIVARE